MFHYPCFVLPLEYHKVVYGFPPSPTVQGLRVYFRCTPGIGDKSMVVPLAKLFHLHTSSKEEREAGQATCSVFQVIDVIRSSPRD